MQDKIIIEQVRRQGAKITVKFSTCGGLTKYFSPQHEFWCEYPETDISSVPDGIAVIPFVANVLPIVWLTDAELVIPELDTTFAESIADFKQGYIDMYPMLKFKGRVKATKLIDQKTDSANKSNSAAFFSGGVDAFCTLYSHLDERPDLLTVWGADVQLTDSSGWNTVATSIQRTAKCFGLDTYCIKTNFRSFLNIHNVHPLISASGDGYWHGFQHGIGLISLAAPLAWLNGWETIYIASSYTAADKGTYTCASDPTIDNYVRMAKCKTVHDGYEFTRQQKVDLICTEAEKRNLLPELRVCWISTGGHNCCRCEKCLRTIFELLAAGRDPEAYGFAGYLTKMKNARRTVLKAYCRTIRPAWEEIREKMSQLPQNNLPKQARWVIDCNFDEKSSTRVIQTLRFIDKIKWHLLTMIQNAFCKRP